MRRPRRVATALAAVALAAAAVTGPAVPAAAGPTVAPDGTGATAGGTATATGPDGHEKAAADNNAIDRAASRDRSGRDDKPVVPQKPGVPATDGTEAADQGAGLAGNTAPAARTQRSAKPVNKPVPGTSASVRFADAAPVERAAVSPHVRQMLAQAKRVRTVTIAPGALHQPLATARVSMQLFADTTVGLETIVALSDGASAAGLSSKMYSAGGRTGIATVTIVGNDVHAMIWKGDRKYGIEPIGNGRHILFEDGRVYPGEDEPADFHDRIAGGPTGGIPSASGPATGTTGGVGTMAAVPVIDVMVAFDEDAQATFGSVAATQAEIIEMINLSNVAYANSQNDQQLALTNILDLNYTPNAADGTDNDFNYLSAIRSKTDGVIDNLHTTRDANSADLVSVVSNVTAFCGVAYLPASADPAELDAFSLVDDTCAVGNLTFPHELGHNMCAHHDPLNAGTNPCASDGYGHYSAADNLRTVMSYANTTNGCGTCTRIPYFSNPNVTYNGWTTGILGSRDNSRVLELKDLDISNYRAPISSPAVAGLDGNSCVFNTIEDAVSMAPAGSTIYIAPGTYPAVTANVNYNIFKNLDLVQGNADCQPVVGGAATNVVLQRHAASTTDSVVEVYSGAVVRFDRVTIEGGNSAEGTLFVSGAQVTLDGSIVRNGNNPSTTVGGGGVRVSGATSQLTSINNSQIENNTARLGGGVYVDDGSVTINGIDNVELNTASSQGGGIYATNNATVTLTNDADVLANTATGSGGGVYLTGTSTLSMSDPATLVGIGSQPNQANLGAGVFATGGSTVTVGNSAAVNGNSGGYGAGIYGLGTGTTVRVDAGGDVTGNTASVNGGGILVTQGALADLNAGADVLSNSADGWGGGVAVFTPATLDADGGTPTVDPVLISGNSAGTVGGGIWSSGTSNLDTVHLLNNSATAEGGGLHVPEGGTVNVTENYGCVGATLLKETYCNEFRNNTAGTTGGAVHAAGGNFTAVQTAFIGNSANEAAVVMAKGDSVVTIRAALAIMNTETVFANEALVTGHDTSSTTLIGMTFAAQSEYFLDTDGTATATVSRVLTTTGTLALVAMPAGGCNQSGVAANLPDLVVAAPQFVPTARSNYVPDPSSVSVDRCMLLGGHSTDIDDQGVHDVPPASVNDYDVGAFEAR